MRTHLKIALRSNRIFYFAKKSVKESSVVGKIWPLYGLKLK